MCCDAPPWFDSADLEDGVCSSCGEHSEFYNVEYDEEVVE